MSNAEEKNYQLNDELVKGIADYEEAVFNEDDENEEEDDSDSREHSKQHEDSDLHPKSKIQGIRRNDWFVGAYVVLHRP